MYVKLLRLQLFVPGRAPFQQDESVVIDLAGGRMAGSQACLLCVGVYLCVRNIFT